MMKPLPWYRFRGLALRWRWRLFWCAFCHTRMSHLFGGRLYLSKRGFLKWECTLCYHSAYRRADS